MVQSFSGAHPAGTKLDQVDFGLHQPEIILIAFKITDGSQAYISSSTMTGT
jgi:hypothetical protein